MRSLDGKQSEEHSFRGDYFPGRIDNTGVYRSYGNQNSCNVATLSPGETRQFYLFNQSGAASGRCGKDTATVRIDGSAAARNRDVYVTLERKEKGATLEFSAASPLPSSDSCDCCINMCAAQVFHPWPNTFEFSEEELTKLGSVSKTVTLTMKPEENQCTGRATARLNAKLDPPDEEMTFQPAASYESWIPAPLPEHMPGIRVTPPATRLRVTVKIQPRKGTGEAREDVIHFNLQDVTRHKGNAGNYPRGGSAKDDLRFSAEQDPGIVLDGPMSAHTREKVSEATVQIEALDTAAYGKLTAKAPKLDLRAIYKPTNTYELVIPRDDDNNKIADAWERQMGLPAQPDVQEDKDPAPGQGRAGDGLTVLDEYRGLVVLDAGGAKVHRRFDPRVRELVIVDPENIFDADLWFKASGVRAVKMDESMIAGGAGAESSRVVNFNTDNDGHFKYAVRVKTMPPSEDMEGERDADPRLGLTPCGACRSPKDADFAAIVPDRVRRVVEREYQNLIKATSDPASPEAKLLADNKITLELARAALATLRNPAVRDALARQMRKHLVLHEVGHAVAAMDHRKSDIPGKEDVIRGCLMYLPGKNAYMRFIVRQVMYGMEAPLSMDYREFCRNLDAAAAQYPGENYNCYSRITIADW